MRNGQLKPGYNVQIGTENQLITGYSIHQNPGDTSCFIEHLDHVEAQQRGHIPKNVIADAGYGSEENYEYLEGHGITGYVKYNTFHKEHSRKWREDPTKIQNFTYDKKRDRYCCPMGREFVYLYSRHFKSVTGYRSLSRIYECLNCSGCVHRSLCMKSEESYANRRLYVNERRNFLRDRAKELLLSDQGKLFRSLRPIEVESVFGDIKNNFGVRRFLLRGLEKVSTEWGLYCIGHNMRKWTTLKT